MLARLVLACALAFALAALANVVDAADPAPDSREFFLQRIRPVLEGRCLACHGDERQKAHLKLNDRSTILAGGTTGPAIVPGDPEHSLLMQRVRARGTDDIMPPEPKEPLDDAQIADLAAWIAAGAPWVHPDGSVEPAPKSGAAAPPSGGEPPTGATPSGATSAAKESTHPPLIGRIHPLVIHFPIACLLLALLAEFLVLVRGPAWEPTVALLLGIGVAGAAVAVLSGTFFAPEGTIFARHDRDLRLHEVAGWLTLVLGLASVTLLIASRSSPRARWYFRLALLFTAIVTGLTGHLGGSMVYPDLALF